MWQTISSGNVWKGEFYNKKKDGSFYWEEATISPIRNIDDEIINYMSVKEDITERKKAEKAMHSMALFGKFNPEPVFRFDKSGTILESNPAANKTFGKESLVGYHVELFLRQTFRFNFETFIKNSQIATIEETFNEKIYRFLLRGIPELEVCQIYGSDITERRKAEEKVRKQKQNIESSIQYAQRIQNAVLPAKKRIAELYPEHFVYFRPRDIVSGDFYWFNSIGNKAVIVAADCTGHGVPGAFMSMLGISFLNELIGTSIIDNAGEILNQLRNKVKTTLDQTGKESEAQDGMDLSLCILDKDTNEMQFAGAYNSLQLIRNNEVQTFKADKMPIGIYIRDQFPFTNHTIQLKKGDTFYILSDGFTDQFGGEKGGKFTMKRFKQLLLDFNQKSMSEQKDILEETFLTWKGSLEQVDDVVVIGVRI